MLRANELSVGSVSDASPLTLVLPRNQYEHLVLVGSGASGTAAIVLSEESKFYWLNAPDCTGWRGILVPNVRIELDETSIFYPDYNTPIPGSLVRKECQLLAHAASDSFLTNTIILEDDLPATAAGAAAGFFNWQIVLGSGQEKRVLHKVAARQSC